MEIRGKKNQMKLLEVTNSLYKMKNSHDQIKRNLGAAKDKISELESVK